ncbi:hypothetical protein BN2476_300117 [Paraburkholderia piptadeniae]|uniref:Uncharacterized protein n=1 Tax=Paraburkholderia piptadeniae TaxID=1701573 RepID=A0A1N7S2V4_9BURK|nr:hypothetical protein BN2476_300117 [Paraburkholderia piptadeniae]
MLETRLLADGVFGYVETVAPSTRSPDKAFDTPQPWDAFFERAEAIQERLGYLMKCNFPDTAAELGNKLTSS